MQTRDVKNPSNIFHLTVDHRNYRKHTTKLVWMEHWPAAGNYLWDGRRPGTARHREDLELLTATKQSNQIPHRPGPDLCMENGNQ